MTTEQELDVARTDWEYFTDRQEEAEVRYIKALAVQTEFKVGDVVEARKRYHGGAPWRWAIVRVVQVWGHSRPLNRTEYEVGFRNKSGEFSKVDSTFVDVRAIGADEPEAPRFIGQITEDML